MPLSILVVGQIIDMDDEGTVRLMWSCIVIDVIWSIIFLALMTYINCIIFYNFRSHEVPTRDMAIGRREMST